MEVPNFSFFQVPQFAGFFSCGGAALRSCASSVDETSAAIAAASVMRFMVPPSTTPASTRLGALRFLKYLELPRAPPRRKPMMMNRLLALAFVLAAAVPAAAQGLVIPDEPDLPPLSLNRHAVRVDIKNQAASTLVEQLFVNNTERRLEAQFLFPIPKDSAISRFSLTIDGKEQAGEVVAKDKARSIYQSLVSRAQDPTLLEHMGGDLFRASLVIDPKAKRTIALRFEQVLPAQDALVRYLYPVRHGTTRGATVNGEFSVEVRIASPGPIGNVYSPSHAITVTRSGELDAKAVFSARDVKLTKDFQLYYGVCEKTVGLNVVAHRADPKQAGTFLMLLSPRSTLLAQKVVQRDVVFVVDTSGSMAGEKIQQAKNALKHCIANLNEGDRFNVVTFSSFADAWKKELVPATPETLKAALARADAILAEGATDIAGAVDTALAFPRDAARPFVVIFMTDGKPTVGDTIDPKVILSRVEKSKSSQLRVFTWGVGYDVDTQLLDAIAASTGGLSEYVHPEEDIATKVSAFWGKASRPVLTNLELAVEGKVQLLNVLPVALPDLYAGGQLVLVGRYTGDGAAKLTLKGRVNDKEETFTFDVAFPADEAKNAFVDLLWAKRRIGHLLDTIRLKGENQELVDDVVRLSKEYGIQTPYTSWIILDDGRVSDAGGAGGGVGGRAMFASADRDRAAEKKAQDKLDAWAKEPPAPQAADEEQRKEHNEAAKALAGGFKQKDGKSAVDTAGYLRRLKESERSGEGLAVFRRAAGTRFFQYRDLWVDERFEAAHAVTSVQFGSAAYFRIVELHPELLEIFKLSTSIVVVTSKGRALVVSAAGEKELSDAKIAELFAR
jgi:Ca-activated chloride channel family protein